MKNKLAKLGDAIASKKDKDKYIDKDNKDKSI